MVTIATTRRLAAILAADVAGYSRLMGADEEGTLAALKAIRRELSDLKIAKHHGRIVKTTGDGLLVEFASVVDAVRCAVEVQRGMAERNAGVAPDKRIEFRIGINLGDVIVEGDDIYGDGINIAARLEGLAEPGGICVSGVVHDQVRDKLDLGFADLGEQQVKNIARPVRVYAWSAAAAAGPPKAGAPTPAADSPHPAAPRLSIVVLPFANLANDPEQQYFADGITEDLTTDLSRIEHLLVISRGTAFTYRDKPVDAKQIGRELGVRYLLEGSVRRSGNQVRVNAQLVDAETGTHLWAERFDRDLGDLFVLQNEITARIANTLNGRLIVVEAARPTDHADVVDYILRGRSAFVAGGLSSPSFAEAIGWFERAVALDPRSVEAQAWLATALALKVHNGFSDDRAGDIARAEKLTAEALAASPDYVRAHLAKGSLWQAQGRPDAAAVELNTVLASDPNSIPALIHLGWCKLTTGSLEEVIPLAERVMRLGPREPGLAYSYAQIGVVHLLQSRTEDAVVWLEKAISVNPQFAAARSFLAAAYAFEGETERAAAELGAARRLSGNDKYSTLARLRVAGYNGSGYWGVPKVRALFEATLFAGLRKAGMPEE